MFKNIKKRIISISLTAFLLITFIPKNVSAEGEQVIKRLWGSNRYGTAVSISKELCDTSENVVLAYGQNFPDALAGVSLAYQLEAPILLTDKNAVGTETMNEIKRLQAKNIYILGGTGVISSSLEQGLKNQGYTTHRIAGSTRYSTAAAIGNEAKKSIGTIDTVIIATAANYPDALSMGPLSGAGGAPILFTDVNKLNTETKNAVSSLNPEYILIAGGTGVVSESVENELKAMGKNVMRLSGKDRYATSLEIAKLYGQFMNTEYITLATGANFPDALAGGVLSAYFFSPLLLINPSSTNTELKAYITAAGYGSMYVYGGSGAVSDAKMNELTKCLNADYYKTPAAPDSLTAEAVSSSSVQLTWNGVGDAAHYDVYRDFEYIGEASVPSYTDTGLEPDTEYDYYVIAVNSYGESQASDIASVTTSAAAPTSLQNSNTSKLNEIIKFKFQH